MAPPLQVKHSFGLQGRWQISTVGLVAPALNDPRAFRVKVALWHQPEPGEVRREDRTIITPLGETLDLYAGAILVDDVVQLGPPPGYMELTVEVDLGQLTLLTRGQLATVLPRLSASEWDQESNALAIGECGGARKLVVPCMEVWRHEYLTSTSLGELILSGAILEPGKHLYSEKRSAQLDSDHRVSITLRRGVLRCDAPIIGRMFVDEVARNRAQAIYRHFIKAGSIQGGFRPLRVYPPMGGHCRWKVWCKEQQTSAGVILVIAKIVSSDAAFPWKILFCSHENDRGPGGTDPKGDPFSPGKPRGQRPTDRKQLSFVYLDTGDSPGGAYVRRAVQTYELNARFSALAASPIERVEATAGVSRSRKRGNKHRPASTLSAQKPGAGEHKSQGLNTSGENTQTEDTQPYSPAEVLRRTLDVVESMAEANCSVRDKVVTVKAASHNDHLFNIPDLNGVRERRWLYLDDERKQQRPIYLAEIEFDRRYLYLLEVVRKAGDAYSMLLFSAPEYEVLSDAHLLSVIGACIGAERVTRLRIEGLKLNFWTFAHRFSVTAGLMAKRVLDATGLMGSEVGEHARA